MTRKVITVAPECPIVEVLSKLHGYRISCVMVCEEETLIGIISERDVVGFAYGHLSGKGETPQVARDLMSAEPTTVCISDSVDHAVAVAEEKRIRHLPVVDLGGRLVGLLTQSDLVRAGFPETE